MSHEITALTVTAATLGFVHTVLGPDHYLPFIMMSKARKWVLSKTMVITFLCGLGHVLSSVVLGIFGVALGIAVSKLEAFEGVRGNIAAWMLIIFGFSYFIWGVHRAIRNRPHTHTHLHADGAPHSHDHSHTSEHTHPHTGEKANITPWILFTIFVFGPCEPLIPILMYPAAKSSYTGMVAVATVFSVVTIGTMMIIVGSASFGLSFLPMKKLERYSHAVAGGMILACGLAMQFLGL